MSRTGWSDTNFLRYAGAVVSAEPVTIACWFNINDFSTERILGGLWHSTETNFLRNSFGIRLQTSGVLRMWTAKGNGSSNLSPSGTYTSGWAHACYVSSSSTSRAAYYNGGGKATDTTTATPTGIDRTSFGCGDISTPTESLSAGSMLAEVGIWNTALSDAEVAALATPGTRPTQIKLSNLVSYWRLLGTASPETDSISGHDFVIQGSLSQGANPWSEFITGVSGTGQVGSILTTAPKNVSLTGVVGTGQIGTLTGQPQKTVSLTGVSGTGGLGTVDWAMQPNMTGVSAAGGVGNFTFADGWMRPSTGSGIWTPATRPPTTWTPASQGSTVWTKQ